MSRSQWKFPISVSQKVKSKIYSRDLTVPYNLVNKIANIYNGKIFVKVKLTKETCGYKFGEFSFTRKSNQKKYNLK